MTHCFKVVINTDYWYHELQEIEDEFITFSSDHEDETVTCHIYDVPDSFVQNKSETELIEEYGINPDYVYYTNYEDLK